MDLNSWLIDLKLSCFYDPKGKNEELPYISGKENAMSLGAFQTAQKLCGITVNDSRMALLYKKELSPFLIRHAIELKIKNEMIGVRSVYTEKDGNRKVVIISMWKYIDFVKENPDIFDLPSSIDIETIKIVNKWSNDFIHTGKSEYLWQLQSAVLAIKPLFESEYSLEPKFRKESVTTELLKKKLKEKFGKDKNFILNR